MIYNGFEKTLGNYMLYGKEEPGMCIKCGKPTNNGDEVCSQCEAEE